MGSKGKKGASRKLKLSKRLNETELVKYASDARKNSYSPYSGVRIGAAVLTEDGSIYTGCNIENASYGLSNCAERTAIFNAVSSGKKKILAIAVCGDSEEFTRPCGACRQVMLEFNNKMKIIRHADDGFHSVITIDKLLPEGFNPSELKNEHTAGKKRQV